MFGFTLLVSLICLVAASRFAKQHRRGLIGVPPNTPTSRKGRVVLIVSGVLALIHAFSLLFCCQLIVTEPRYRILGGILLLGLTLNYIAIQLTRFGIEDDGRPRKKG